MTKAKEDYLIDSRAGTSLPLVSVIIVNFNYGIFLEEAAASVLRQTYERIEFIIVDDASTDHSRSVIANLSQQFPFIKTILRAENGGSTVASVDGFRISTGSFVSLLDADDTLFKNFVEMHIRTHLSVRYPIGFSCCDMLQNHGGQLLSCGDTNISRFIAAKRDRSMPDCRRIPPPFGNAFKWPTPRLYMVEPWDLGWPWTATSAIVYRRTALALFVDTKGASLIRASTDAFFAYGINAVSGSVIIDEPLATYRTHGRNCHAKQAPLNHVMSFDVDERQRKTSIVVQVLLQHVIEKADLFCRLFWHRSTYFALLQRLSSQHPTKKHSALRVVWTNRKTLRPIFGSFYLLAWSLGLTRR